MQNELLSVTLDWALGRLVTSPGAVVLELLGDQASV